MNLSKDIYRNENILAQFRKYNITNFERIEGTIFTEIPDKKIWRNFNNKDEKYILANIGHRDSTLKIINISKERNYDKILILEDDIKITVDPNILLNRNENIINDWDFLYFGGLMENFYRNQIVCAHAYAIRSILFDDIINMLPTSGMETDNFYAKIMQHMSYNHNKSGMYNTRIVFPFNTIIQDRIEYNSNINDKNNREVKDLLWF
jgi:hypothetical protein